MTAAALRLRRREIRCSRGLWEVMVSLGTLSRNAATLQCEIEYRAELAQRFPEKRRSVVG